MEFIKETSVKGAFIPRSALKLSGFAENERTTLRTLPGVALLTRRRMTAMDMIQAIDSLTELAAELFDELGGSCGPCDQCGEDGCPYDDMDHLSAQLPDDLREEAGIPAGAKLCVQVDSAAHTVTVVPAEHKYDLTDVPEDMLDLLIASGVCLGELEEKLISGEVIYDG